MADQSTNFTASNGEYRNPFYRGTFEDETAEQMERRLYWAAAAVEAERVVQNNKTAPQPVVQGEPVGFCEDTALSLAERTFSTEVDEQLAEDIIQYARRLHGLHTTPQPEVSVPEIIEAVANFVGSQEGGPFTPAVIKAVIIGQLEYGNAFTKLLPTSHRAALAAHRKGGCK